MFGTRKNKVVAVTVADVAATPDDPIAVQPLTIDERFEAMIAELDAALASVTGGLDRIEQAVADTFARAWKAALPTAALPFDCSTDQQIETGSPALLVRS